jgi:hypothetical protein
LTTKEAWDYSVAVWDRIIEEQFILVQAGYEYEAIETMSVIERSKHLELYYKLKEKEANALKE